MHDCADVSASLCDQPRHVAGGAHREKKRSRKALGLSILPMPAGKLPYDMSGLEGVSLQNAPKRWSSERCRNCLAKVMAVLKVTRPLLRTHHTRTVSPITAPVTRSWHMQQLPCYVMGAWGKQAGA